MGNQVIPLSRACIHAIFVFLSPSSRMCIDKTSFTWAYLFFAHYIFAEALKFAQGRKRGLQRNDVMVRRNRLIDLERSAIQAYRSIYRGKGVVHRWSRNEFRRWMPGRDELGRAVNKACGCSMGEAGSDCKKSGKHPRVEMRRMANGVKVKCETRRENRNL